MEGINLVKRRLEFGKSWTLLNVVFERFGDESTLSIHPLNVESFPYFSNEQQQCASGTTNRVVTDIRKSESEAPKSEIFSSENPIIRHPRF
jgi:hypothetical protein